MTRFTETDFCNYRNLARRAESAGHAADELRYLEKCAEIHSFLPRNSIGGDTFLQLVARINQLNADRIKGA